MKTKTITKVLIFSILILFQHKINCQIGKEGGGIWCLGVNQFYCTEKGMYSVYSKPISGDQTFRYHASDKGSNIRPEFGQLHIFNSDDDTYIDANIGILENLTLFLGTYKPEKNNLGHHYAPKGLSKRLENTSIVHKIYYAEYWNFKFNLVKKNFFYGFNWRQLHLSAENLTGRGNGVTIDTFVYKNNLVNSKHYKAVYGLNMGLISNFGKKITWVNQFTFARDLAFYKDNGRYVDGSLIHNSDIFINRNYNLNSTMFYGVKNGFFVGANYDVLKGKLLDGTIPYQLTKLSLKFGVFFTPKS